MHPTTRAKHCNTVLFGRHNVSYLSRGSGTKEVFRATAVLEIDPNLSSSHSTPFIAADWLRTTIAPNGGKSSRPKGLLLLKGDAVHRLASSNHHSYTQRLVQ